MAALSSLVIQVVTNFCNVPGGDRTEGKVELRLLVLFTHFSIPLLAGFGMGHIVAGSIFRRLATGVTGGLIISGLTIGTWAFTYREWWPADEPIVFLLITMLWTVPTIAGCLGSIVTQRLPGVG